jgi:tetratricopeptide (TPR) repeat protein
MRTPHRFSLLGLFLLLLSPACETLTRQKLGGGGQAVKERPDDVGWLVSHGRFEEAVQRAQAVWNESPDDPQAEIQYRMATVALYLERGRRLAFEDRNEEALDEFLAAKELAPDEKVINTWIGHTRLKLARRWELEASRLHIRDELAGAVEHYEKALGFEPTYDRARIGLARALLQINHRQGMGQKYYEDGVKAFNELYLQQARTNFEYTQKYTPDDPRAEDRKAQAQTQLADERCSLAIVLEGEGRFAGARNEYRMALLLDEDHPEAAAGLARMTVESKAAEHLREAERHLFRGHFDQAAAAMERCSSITERQFEGCEAMAAAVEEARLNEMYETARVFESDQRFEEAVVAYSALLERADYFQDTIARRDTLEDYIAEAGRLYDQVLAAEGPEEEATYLRRIDIFWPDYKDVRERLKRVEAEAPALGPDGSAPGQTP